MFYQTVTAVGGMIALVSLFFIFQLLAERMRALDGECHMNGFRCLGCLASGRCRQERAEFKRRIGPVHPGSENYRPLAKNPERKNSS